MTSGIDAGLRINDHSMLVECEKGDYSYKLVIYDNTFEENPIKAIYAISRSNEPTTNNNFDEKLIAEYITTLEDKNMITSKCLKGYLKLSLKMLDEFSDDTAVEVTDLLDTDEKYLRAEEILKMNPTEQEFLEQIRSL